MSRVVAAVVLVACVALGARPADARTTRGPDARERAGLHYKTGSAKYAAGDYSVALAEFEAGYAAHPSPAFLVNIGQCLRKLDRLDEAAMAFRRFLDSRSGAPATRLDVWDALEDVLAELNHRVDSLAESAVYFRAFLATSEGDAALRAKTARALDDIMHELVRIDDTLVGGYGVARGFALPRVPSARVAGGPEAADHIHQRLAAMAATRNPTATRTSHRSPRSASHSHMRR
jgi:tetratricopeptide (TPR) repeat protein